VPSLGITGGIATGKSYFTARLLQCLPAAHFDADRSAHELLESDPEVRRKVLEEFGVQAFAADGKPNRNFLREVVFRDEERRKALEAILHPAIRKTWTTMAEKTKSNGDWLFVDIPLLFETGVENAFDHVVVVACSAETQLRRMAELRHLPAPLARKIISTQIDLPTKMNKAHHVIWNDSSPTCLEQQTAHFAELLRHYHA